MIEFFRRTYLQPRFFIVLAALACGYLVSFMDPDIFGAIRLLFYFFLLVTIADLILVHVPATGISGERGVPDKLSNGDENNIALSVRNRYLFPVSVKILDELPYQFQQRHFGIFAHIGKGQQKQFTYTVRPVQRGLYSFGALNVYASSPLKLIARRYIFSAQKEVPVYPSFLQLRKYDLIAFTNRLYEYGIKKIRRIGHTMEFEHIREYVRGDDIRNINWKATAKKHQLMVNQFQDERAQPVYSVIDKGRVMRMPFENLSLLDYAINATLVISNIAIKKQDKAGMFAFSSRVENRVVAQRRSSQMNLILETLYNLDTNFDESDFRRLYTDIKRHLNHRSLLLLYTNFETLDALERQLPYLVALSKLHLLVVIFFENTELSSFAATRSRTTHEIFQHTIAEKFIYEKKLIVNEMHKHGIQVILTKPADLTLNTINKYLEIKARGLI